MLTSHLYPLCIFSAAWRALHKTITDIISSLFHFAFPQRPPCRLLPSRAGGSTGDGRGTGRTGEIGDGGGGGPEGTGAGVGVGEGGRLLSTCFRKETKSYTHDNKRTRIKALLKVFALTMVVVAEMGRKKYRV